MKTFLLLLLVSAAAIVQISHAKSNFLDSYLSSSSLAEDENSMEEVEPCRDGFYSQGAGNCVACTECGTNLYVREQCHDNADTVCDWCLSDSPDMNEDYFRECRDSRKLYEKIRDEFRSEIRRFREENGVEKSTDIRGWVWLFYTSVAVIALLSALMSFWMFCARRKYTRVINVMPPQLSETDERNMIFAAKEIREKLVNKHGKFAYEHV